MKIIVLFCIFFSVLFSAESITWVKWDLEPNYIFKGELKNQGWADKRLKMLKNRLPQYKHNEVVMNASRFIKTFNHKDDSKTLFCTNDIISHPHMDFDDYLSTASFPFMGYFLVTTSDKAHLFAKQGESVKMKDVIQNKKLRLVIAKNRPYLGASDVIEEYIRKHPKQEHINILSTRSIGKSMFESVIKNRADYTIEYDFRVTYYAKELNRLNDIAVFPIEEDENIYYGYVSCMKTKKGKKAIDEINNILREFKTNEEWVNAFVDWLPSQKRKDDYMKYYNEIFLTQGDIYDSNPRSN